MQTAELAWLHRQRKSSPLYCGHSHTATIRLQRAGGRGTRGVLLQTLKGGGAESHDGVNQQPRLLSATADSVSPLPECKGDGHSSLLCDSSDK